MVVIVPPIILDELDGLKQRGGDATRKWRASYTLAILEDVFSPDRAYREETDGYGVRGR